ncbi:MAG: alpha/beta hydrolase family protein [Acidobacteriia bacterium]|nr:alpha/beta hydrolase family protein [Terriglobia bacterium]
MLAVLPGLSTCSGRQPGKPPVRYDALSAMRVYNDFMEQTLEHVRKLPDKTERRAFVNQLRPAMEAATARWREQIDGEMSRNTFPRTSKSPEFQAEYTRMTKLAPPLTEELRKYASP